MSKKPPKYARHSSGQARVRVNGQVVYLGKFGSPESYAEYRRVLTEMECGAATVKPNKLTVAQLAADYGKNIEGRYAKKQQERIKRALGCAVGEYADKLADEFRLPQIDTVRRGMVEAGWSRTYINSLIICLKQAFRWAGQRRLVSAECVADLALLQNLRMNELGVTETAAVQPVEWEDVRKALRYLRPQTRAMVLLQWHAGMRTQEVCLMRPGDIDRKGKVWLYRPQTNKNAWRGQERVVYLGPAAQRILRRYLAKRPADAYCFTPREAMQGVAGGGRKNLKPFYTSCAYAQAVARACAKAGVNWHPYRLRHSAATRISDEYDPETARLVLGQRSFTSTRRYVKDLGGKAAEAMRKIG